MADDQHPFGVALWARISGDVFGRPWTGFTCVGCGYETRWAIDGEDGAANELHANLDIADHLLTEHPDAVADLFGYCAHCHRITQYFHADGGPTGRLWLCEDHAPAMPNGAPS